MAERWFRRDFVGRMARAAGVAPAFLAVIEGTGEALPRSEENDLAILHASLTIEHHAIALYEAALRGQGLASGIREYAVEFRGDHLGHRDTQIAISEERGGRPPVALTHYDFGHLGTGDELLRDLLEVEVAAQKAYSALIAQIHTRDYLLSAAFILVDEVRHMTVWQRMLGLRIY